MRRFEPTCIDNRLIRPWRAALFALAVVLSSGCASDSPSSTASKTASGPSSGKASSGTVTTSGIAAPGGARKSSPGVSPTSSANAQRNRREEPPTAADKSAPQLQIDLGAHAAPVRGIAVTSDGKYAITVSDDKSARVWSLSDKRLRHVLRPAAGAGSAGSLYGVAAHPSDDLVAVAGTSDSGTATRNIGVAPGTITRAVGEGRLLLFRPSTGEFVRAIDARGDGITKLAFTPDGKLLLALYRGGRGGALRAFALDGKPVFEEHFGEASYGLAVSANGRIAASSYDGKVRLYRYSDAGITPVLAITTSQSAPRGVAFSPDGRLLAVGYRGTTGDQGSPTLLDVESGRELFTLPRLRLGAGNFGNVAFSADGRHLLATGSAYGSVGAHPIVRYELASRRVTDQQIVATNTVTDLTATPDGRILYASFDGGWGVLDARMRVEPAPRALTDLRGAQNLRIDADAQLVGVALRYGDAPQWFDLRTRTVTRGKPKSSASGPLLRSPRGKDAQWENTRRPQVNGSAIALAADDIARSIAFATDGRAMLGTNKQLMMINPAGKVEWTVDAPAEVWSLNLRADGQVVVGALADGTVRWWRTSNGEMVLSLLMLPDERWIVWNPAGYFDASAGGDRLAGWAVNRDAIPVADFYSLNRFRERFNRPDLIDRIAGARSDRDALAATNTVEAAPQAFPPVLGQAGDARYDDAGNRVTIPFTLRALTDAKVEVRVDGRPAPDAKIEIAASGSAGTERTGEARLAMPAGMSTVQLIARDANGWSEPLAMSLAAPVIETPVVIAPPIAPAVAPAAAPSVNPTIAAATSPSVEPAVAAAPSVKPQATSAPSPGGASASSAPASETVAAAAATLKAAAATTSSMVPVPASAPIASIAPIGPVATTATAATATAPPILALPAVTTPAKASGTTRPRLFVLAVGISDYKTPAYKLGLPAKDATDFAAVLKAQAGRNYAEVQTRVLTDAKATRANIEAEFEWLRSAAGPEDVGILFLAGHGINTETGDYHFLPWDGDHRNLAQTAVPESSIRKTLGNMRGKALLFVDTCYAGAAVGTLKSSRRELARLANDLASSENGVVVFASSTGRQLSEENDAWGNGAFTKAAIDGMRGKADFQKRGSITYKALDYFISDEVRRLTEGRQTPVTISPIGVPDFAIVRNEVT